MTMLIRNIEVVSFMIAIFTVGGCTTAASYRYASQYSNRIESGLSLSHISAIHIMKDQSLLASIVPVKIDNQNGKLYFSWHIVYISSQDEFGRNFDNALAGLVRFRIIDQSKKNGASASVENKYIRIGEGNSDNYIIINQNKEYAGQYKWSYYSGRGLAASGDVLWSLR